MNNKPRLFAVIPAAGLSRRMGRPKLMMKLGGETVIRRLLDVLRHETITARIVVARQDDADLIEAATLAGANVETPAVDPPDMRTSVEHGLDWLEAHWQPSASDGWLLVPGDHPMLDRDCLDQLIDAWRSNSTKIVIPTYRGRRGHPTLLPWELAGEVSGLPRDTGLNLLIRRHAERIVEVPINNPAVTTDLDTPDDFERLRRQFGDNSGS